MVVNREAFRISSLALLLFLGAVPAANADICVTSLLTNVVLRFDDASGVPIGFCAVGGGLNGPRGIALGPDGNLYVSDTGNHRIVRYSGSSGALIDVFVPGGSGGLFEPQDLTFGPDGNLYVTSFISVLRYSGVDGAALGSFASVFGGVQQLTFGPDGNLYVTNFSTVQRFNGTTGAFLNVFASTGLLGAHGLAFGSNNDLYVSSNASDEVVRFDGTTGANVGSFPAAGGPLGLAFGADGHLYVGSRDTDSVLRYNVTTGASLGAVIPQGSGGLDIPVDIAFMVTLTPSELLQQLIQDVKNLNFQIGKETSLLARLSVAVKRLEDTNDAAAIGALGAFINELLNVPVLVDADGQPIPGDQRDALVATAQGIVGLLEP